MRKRLRSLAACAAVAAGLSLAGVAPAAITIETVPVGHVGNAPDPLTGYGQVNYAYNIGKYEVTAGQYTEFLNAVAATDTYALYNTEMSSTTSACGISRTGTPGNYRYSVAAECANRPVNYVLFWDACRFANWLQNGQPTGAQGPGTTETGAYTLTASGIANNTVTRSAGTTWAVTSEDEWYKAAYYDPATTNYYVYPTGSNSRPWYDIDDRWGNNANLDNLHPLDGTHLFTVVGQFQNSGSPYGTFDQAGNVWEWNEAIITDQWATKRGIRGGCAMAIYYFAVAGERGSMYLSSFNEQSSIGFRVVQVPEPTSAAVLVLGGAGLLVRRRATAKASIPVCNGIIGG